ncbi:MAG TPA: protein kinase [Gemmataceae bacterium]|nr:protein kinase [Gemmataceae bacterium]
MAMPLTCPRGHQWDPNGHQTLSAPPACPICGLAPVSPSAAFPPTLELQPDPRELDPSSSDTPSERPTIPATLQDTRERAAPLLSQHVPGYEILGELGRGGMGVVYKARQIKLDRIVALKMILAGAQADPQQLERFLAEAAAVARLQHPYIVQIHEISDHNGCPFFSLEYVDGGTLAEKLNGAPQPPRLAAHLIRLLAQAIHSAHQKGIIHRDLKPGNILLAASTDQTSGSDNFDSEIQAAYRLYGIPKISDFGLAKHLDIQSQTRTGAILGTPSYMAPEQAEGHTHAIGPATDVYGLGAILYELLTGRPPFESESSLTTIRQLLGQDPVPPSHLHRKVPRDLETICLKCLEKDPVRRYHSAEELAEDLHRFLSNQTIEARPAGWSGRTLKWIRRHPTKTTAGVVVVCAIFTLLMMGLVYHLRMEKAFEQTQRYAEESRQNLIRLHVTQGTSAMNSGDGFTALLWFTEALRLDAGPPEHERPHRQRIAALEQGLPRPELLWVHEGAVNEIRFSPDGRRVLTAGEDGKVHLWDSESGQAVFPPWNEGGAVTQALFSSDGRRIAAAGRNGAVHIWDAASGQPLMPALSHRGAVRGIDFSPDDRQIVTASGKAARVWDVAEGAKPLAAWELKHDDAVNVALFSPDGRWLATAGDDGVVRIWDAANHQPTPIVLSHERAVLCLAFSPDSKQIASGSSDHTAQVWNLADGAPVGGRLHHRGRVLHVRFSPFGHRLLTASEDGTALLWRVGDDEPVVEPLRHTSIVRWAEFSPDGCRIATASDDNTSRLWSATKGIQLTTPLRSNGSVNHVAFSPDGRRLAMASDDGTARVWDIACRLQAHVVNEADVFRHQADRDLRLGDLSAPRRADALRLAERTSPDGRLVLQIDNHDTVRICDAHNGEPVAPPLTHRGQILYAAFSPDGQRVVTTSADQTARVWNTANGAPASPPLMHASAVEFADFSPHGQRLVTASDDNTARIWDIASGAMLVPPLKHDGTVVQAIFSSDGRRVATGGLDQTARVWDAATGQSLTPPFQHPWSVRHVRFSPDGQHLLTSGSSDIVWSWGLPCTACPTDDLVRLAQLLSGSRIDEHRGVMPLVPVQLKDLWTSLHRTQSGLFRFSAEEVTVWHRQTADECMRARHWSAALWHLDRLLQHEPDNWLYHARRGRVRAELGKWTEASADFAEVVRRAPEQAEAWCLYAALRLHEGDAAGYRRACAALLRQEEKSHDPRMAYLAAWICVLSADTEVKGKQLVELAKQAVEREPREPDYLGTLGAAEFRAGNLEAASRRLKKALAIRGRRPSSREWLWLALVHQQMGQPSEARTWLEKAVATLSASDANALPWVQRLQLELLRREAEKLLK